MPLASTRRADHLRELLGRTCKESIRMISARSWDFVVSIDLPENAGRSFKNNETEIELTARGFR